MLLLEIWDNKSEIYTNPITNLYKHIEASLKSNNKSIQTYRAMPQVVNLVMDSPYCVWGSLTWASEHVKGSRLLNSSVSVPGYGPRSPVFAWPICLRSMWLSYHGFPKQPATTIWWFYKHFRHIIGFELILIIWEASNLFFHFCWYSGISIMVEIWGLLYHLKHFLGYYDNFRGFVSVLLF